MDMIMETLFPPFRLLFGSPFYACKTCNFSLHSDCFKLHKEITHPSIPTTFSLSSPKPLTPLVSSPAMLAGRKTMGSLTIVTFAALTSTSSSSHQESLGQNVNASASRISPPHQANLGFIRPQVPNPYVHFATLPKLNSCRRRGWRTGSACRGGGGLWRRRIGNYENGLGG
nr:uncharacterized protein LOC109186382 [Ipomoea batatas]